MNQKLTGGCHCGKVRYEASLDPTTGLECNCSICAKRAHLLAFTPADQFRQLAGQDALQDYQFGRKTIHHMFCRACGIGTFGKAKAPDGKDMVAINLRTVDNIDLTKVKIEFFDGKHKL